MRSLFVTGTDTGVGKTFCTVLLIREFAARGLRVGAYKPACSGSVVNAAGAPVWEDVQALSTALDDAFPPARVCPQCFHAPLAPPASAALENSCVDSALLRTGFAWWSERVDLLLIEGVGGLLCPLTETETIADLAVDLGAPLLIVARCGLGTINHTLLTIEAARSRGLAIAGVLLNAATPADAQADATSNAREIEDRGGAPVVGVVRHATGATLSETGLRAAERGIRMDWLERLVQSSVESQASSQASRVK